MALRVPVNLRKNLSVVLYAFQGLSILAVIVGLASLFLLPLDEYSRRTYISENALLPGQVHAYFGGSEQNIVRAFRREVDLLGNSTSDVVAERMAEIFRSAGLKVGKQRYSYKAAGGEYTGENVYAVLHAPRGDATEAIVLCAPWRNIDHLLNEGGVALTLALSRYFKRWSLWSKDIIFLISSDARAGPQAWVDAYHDLHGENIQSLSVKSGAIQGVVVVDYPGAYHRFESLHILYDGINGQLPNLDLINTAVQISRDQMGLRTDLQEMWNHDDGYRHRLKTMLRGMVNQALGHSTGPHSSFIPYHIDAITLATHGDGGWHDEGSLGRTVESVFRSLNNLLEHFHQSFFFYLLMAPKRFVSIGTYLPAAMLLAVGLTLTAIRLWVDPRSRSGEAGVKVEEKEEQKSEKSEKSENVKGGEVVAVNGGPKRELFLPMSIVIGVHFCGVIPFAVFNSVDYKSMSSVFYIFIAASVILPTLISILITLTASPHRLLPAFHLSRCFSLLFLGMFLSTLATLNFSLSFLIGLFSLPLMFARTTPDSVPLALVNSVLLQLTSPFAALFVVAGYWGLGVEDILKEASFGWWVWGMWTPIVVWCVWWPAWVVGRISVDSSIVMAVTGKRG
ncbi:Glycosyl phosphatidyl inositol protein transamidase complex subunit [Orbilia oligospora]|uniref:Glycosyl phosphatidyl inositol protein transamidase complex subunit n=1 Tax=Orbilia oligospora TaxID=2813651 RepID=A0A7C8IVZ6_ORBOL|nr:Glycosyl phosphatidyl inositol protein transamidase complex subunit [Orbilia oligospora]KAF3078821.1 Glycosyl phosphatidyl inositol protein transamidase complex subunit [Orbilia oligospora]